MYARYIPPDKPKAPPPEREPEPTQQSTSGGDFSYARYIPPLSSTKLQGADSPHAVATAAEKEKHGPSNDDGGSESEADPDTKKIKKSKKKKKKKKTDKQDSVIVEIPHGTTLSQPTQSTATLLGDQEERDSPPPSRKWRMDDEDGDEDIGMEDQDSAVEPQAENETSKKRDKKPKKDKKKKNEKAVIAGTDDNEERDQNRHSGILAKKARSLQHAARVEEAKEEPSNAAQEDSTPADRMRGLEPLPQPDLMDLDHERPNHDLLPPWLRNPTRVNPSATKSFEELGIDPRACRSLEKKGLTEAFAVQTAIIPFLAVPGRVSHVDVLVEAPTGSGKTLAYVVPIVRDVCLEVVTRIRAVVVLPTRELITQVHSAFELAAQCFAGGEHKRLRIGVAMGNRSLEDDQALFLERWERPDKRAYEEVMREREHYSWAQKEEVKDHPGQPAGRYPNWIIDYKSKIDVLICTPGRLVEHITHSPGFDLSYVRWLVVDEADKLLSQNYQNWLSVLMPKLKSEQNPWPRRIHWDEKEISIQRHIGVRKLIFSATLPKDLSVLNPLDLQTPYLIIVEAGESEQGLMTEHSLPEMLREHVVRVVDTNLKPLYLLDLLLSRHMSLGSELQGTTNLKLNASARAVSPASTTSSEESSSYSDSDSSSDRLARDLARDKAAFRSSALIFTKSNESALRLSRLLAILSPSLGEVLGTLTSTAPTKQRHKTVRAFGAGKLRILVASDLVSRGIDLPLLDHVINYDLPPSLEGYVHRVGRTARAGRAGNAWTLLPDSESGWFWGKIAKGTAVGRSSKVERVKVGADGVAPFEQDKIRQYETALKELGDEAADARRGRKV